MPAPLPTGLVRYDKALDSEILAFLREAYPQRPPEMLAPRWRWMFLESADRVGVTPYVWMYRKASGVIAHQGALAVKLKAAGEIHTTGWFVETMVLPTVRNGAVGPGVITKARDDLPFNLSLGQTPQMRSIQFQLGWQQVTPLKTFVMLLSPATVLRSKLRNPALRALAAMGLKGYAAAYRWLRAPARDWKSLVIPIDSFDERHDRLWNQVAPQYLCAVVRDASYLNWKYVRQPGQKFIRLEITREDRAVGLAVLTIREPDADYHYRRALLVDLVVDPSDRQAVWATLDAARCEAVDRQCDTLTFHLISRALEPIVRSFGFIEREATRHLLVAPGGAPGHVQAQVLQGDAWLVTQGDSDIDRPY